MSCTFLTEESRESSLHSRSNDQEGMFVVWPLHLGLLNQCVHQCIFLRQWPMAFTMDLSVSHQSDEQMYKFFFEPTLNKKSIMLDYFKFKPFANAS